jgi:hypothetical protein
MRTGPLGGASYGYTSGSTGTPSIFLSIPEELDHLNSIGSASRADRKRTLVFTQSHHGPAGFSGFPENLHSHPLIYPENLEQVALVLEREVEPFASLQQIQALAGTLNRIKELTLFLMHRRGRVDDLGITKITVGRHILSPLWKHRLETWWGAQVDVGYGFSEMRQCNSLQCKVCGYFHIPPTGFVEVLEVSDKSPVAPGARGLLAVTGFHPYFTVEPRVRYIPGDLAELAPHPCPRWGELGFRPIGRQRDSIPLSSAPGWLGPVDVYAAVADQADAYRFKPPVYRTQPLKSGYDELIYSETGSPRFILQTGATPRICVELRYDPMVWPDQAMQASAAIGDAITYDIDVSVHGPGHLGEINQNF